MQATNHRETRQNTVLLGWVYIVANALLLIAGALVFFLLFGLGYAACAWEPFIILGGLGVFLGVLIIVLALLGILAGCGLVKGCAWGRTLGILVAVLGLICFPIGTLIGIFALFVLLQDGGDACYRPNGSDHPKDPCRPKDPCQPKDPCDRPKDPPDRPRRDPCDWPSRDPRDWPEAPYERPSRDPRD